MSPERIDPPGAKAHPSVMSLIRQTETDLESWFASRRGRGPRNWSSEGMRSMIDQVIAPENREWYYKTMAKFERQNQQGHKSVSSTAKTPRMSGRSFNSGSSHSRAPSLEEYLNKPLPPLPESASFEYLFADADAENNELEDIEKEQDQAEEVKQSNQTAGASISSGSSIGLDRAELARFAYAQAGVDICTNGKTRDSSPAHFPSDDSTVVEASHPSGTSDREQMQYEFSQSQSQQKDKVILQPKSQKSKSHLRGGQALSLAPERIITAPAVQPLTLTAHKASKRSARDSFLTKSTVKGNNDDISIQLVSTKKVRVEEQQHSQNVKSMRASSVYSKVSAASSSYSVASTVDEPLPLRKRLTNAPTGYPGQFKSYESDFLHCRVTGIPSPRINFTCGDPLHPNNQFTHTNFIADPTWPSKIYTKKDLERFPMREAALAHADRHMVRAARILTRTESEENLRREVQRECAAARLEGVAVGQYRYYQGHMSMEEYKAANVCICWDSCWCSKLCTIYGDVLCPCNEWLVLHNH